MIFSVDATTNRIILGVVGDDNVTEVHFDVKPWVDAYGDSGLFSLLNKRQGDTTAYPVEIRREGNTVIWTVSEIDTAKKGYGECELCYVVDDKTKYSRIFSTILHRSFIEVESPEPYEIWLDKLLKVEDKANANETKIQENTTDIEQNAADISNIKQDIIELEERKGEVIKLYFDGDAIYESYEAWEDAEAPMTFEEIADLAYRKRDMVYLGDGQMKYYPQLDLNVPTKDSRAIEFMSSGQLDGENFFTRVIINENNEVKTDQIVDINTTVFAQYKNEVASEFATRDAAIQTADTKAGNAQTYAEGVNTDLQAFKPTVPTMDEFNQLSESIHEILIPSPNILPLYSERKTALGLTIDFDGNIITINGTSNASGNIQLYDYVAFLENNKDYTFSARYVSGSYTGNANVAQLGMYTRETASMLGSLVDVRTIYNSKSAFMSFNADVKKLQYARLNVAGTGVTFNNLRIALQLEKGTEATEYKERGNMVNPNGLFYSKADVDNLFKSVSDPLTYELKEKGKTFRMLCATDLHCGSDCGGKYGGVWQSTADFMGCTYKERMQTFVDAVNKENREKPIDLLLITGDISVNGISTGDAMKYLKEFVNDYAPQLDMPVFYIPGNHDPYVNEDWKSVIGYDREFSIETDDYYFICLDSFRVTETGLEVPYTGFGADSLAFLRSEIVKAGKKKIFVCSHYFQTDKDAEFWEIFYTTPNIVGRIEGHAHMWLQSWTKATYGGVEYQKYRANNGGFVYPTTEWEDGIKDHANLWGVRMIEFDHDTRKLYTWEIQPAHYYKGINVDMPYTIGSKSSMGTMEEKNPRATFYVPSAYRSMDRITRAISDIQNRLSALESN